MDINANDAPHKRLLSAKVTEAAGDTTTTDPRSQRNRVSRRGGQLLTRARSSSCTSTCPHIRAPCASVPDGRTKRHNIESRQGIGTGVLIPVTNPIERLNGEIKRRTNVVGVVPNEAAITRLIGAILLEQNDEWSVQRGRYMSLETMAPLSDNPIVMLSAVPGT